MDLFTVPSAVRHERSGTGMWGRCFMETKHLSASSEHPPYPLRHLRRDAARCKTYTGSQRFPVFFAAFDCEKIPAASESYDLVIANHVLFYCDNLEMCVRSPAGTETGWAVLMQYLWQLSYERNQSAGQPV